MEVDIINEEYGPVIPNVWKPIETAPRNQEIFVVGWFNGMMVFRVIGTDNERQHLGHFKYWTELPPRGE